MSDKHRTRTKPGRRSAQRNAGAFLGPDILVPVPMRTLSDDYHDIPTDPEEEPEPELEEPGVVRRVVDRLIRRLHPGG